MAPLVWVFPLAVRVAVETNSLLREVDPYSRRADKIATSFCGRLIAAVECPVPGWSMIREIQ